MEAEIQRANRRALRVEKGRRWKQKNDPPQSAGD